MPRGTYFRSEYHKKQMSIILSESMNRPEIIKKQRQGALRRWKKEREKPVEKIEPKEIEDFDSYSTETLEKMANDLEGEFSLAGLVSICREVFQLSLRAEKTIGFREKYLVMLRELSKHKGKLEEARKRRRGQG